MRRILTLLVLYPLILVGSCTGVLFGFTSWGLERAIEPVDGPTPPSFPVMALTGSAEQLVLHPLLASQVDSFTTAHTGLTFRIPPERADALRTALTAGTRASSDAPFAQGDDRPWSADFEIEEDGPGGQLVRASVTFDDDDVNDGWYRASAAGFTPLRHRSGFGPRVGAGGRAPRDPGGNAGGGLRGQGDAAGEGGRLSGLSPTSRAAPPRTPPPAPPTSPAPRRPGARARRRTRSPSATGR